MVVAHLVATAATAAVIAWAVNGASMWLVASALLAILVWWRLQTRNIPTQTTQDLGLGPAFFRFLLRCGLDSLVGRIKFEPREVVLRGANNAEFSGTAPFRKLSTTEQENLVTTVMNKGWGARLNLHTRIFINLCKKLSAEALAHPVDFSKIQVLPKGPLQRQSITHFGKYSFRLANDDEDLPDFAPLGKTVALHLRDLPMDFEDQDPMFFGSDAEAVVALSHALPQQVFPECSVVWDEVSSDESFSNLFFFGPGQLYLEGISDRTGVPPGATLQVDFSLVSKLEHRPGMLPGGAVAYFSDDRKALGIRVCHSGELVNPTSRHFEHAKFVMRGGLLTFTQLSDHVPLHFVTANAVCTACRECLSADHPVRRLLKPYTYRTTAINYRAGFTLHGPCTIFHRLSALTAQGWNDIREHFLGGYKYAPVRQTFEQKNLPKQVYDSLPLVQDGMKILSIYEEFVQGYLDVFYGTDDDVKQDPELQAYWELNDDWIQGRGRVGLPPLSKAALVDQIVHYMWSVTVRHEMSGAIGEVVMLADGPTTRIYDAEQTRPDVLSFFQGSTLLSLTSLSMPQLLTVDWRHLYLDKNKAQVLQLHERYREQLRALSNEIAEVNKTRPKAFRGCDPDILEISVSL